MTAVSVTHVLAPLSHGGVMTAVSVTHVLAPLSHGDVMTAVSVTHVLAHQSHGGVTTAVSVTHVLELDGDLLDLVGQFGLGLLQGPVAHAQLLASVFQLCDADVQTTSVEEAR